MTSEMQARIARALCSRQCVGVWEGQPSMVQEGFLLDALATMKAMREPTAPMIEAGWNARGEVDDRYTAMIDREISLAEGGSNDRD